MVTGPLADPVPTVSARVLGEFEVAVGDRRLTRADWQRASAERLVKLLLVAPDHRVSREIAAETLWPGAGPDAGRASLRKAIHFASQALRDTGVLVEVDHTLALDPRRLEVDLDRLAAAFDALAADESPRRPTGARADHIDRACPGPHQTSDGPPGDAIGVVLALGSRELLPDDLCEDWLVVPRERLRSRWQRIALRAAERAAHGGRADEALEMVAQLLERDATDEAVHRLAIGIYAAEGRHHAARRQFELCRQALRDGLDVDPSQETVDAFRAAERTADSGLRRPAADTRLVARQQELEQVEPLLDHVAAGRLAALVIRGPAGIGKTRLLDEVVEFARAAGWRVLEWRAVESAAALAYAPLRIALAGGLAQSDLDELGEPARSAVATLIPGIDPGPRLRFEDQSAFVAALVMAIERLARSQPIAIAIDDLPWLDPSSLALLGAIVSGLADVPVLVTATYRDDEPSPPGVLEFLAQARRAGGTEIPLGPLAFRDVEPLIVGHLGGRTVQPEVAREVHERSLGNPLFCLELVRTCRDRGTLRLADDRWSMAAGDRGGGAGWAIEGELPRTIRSIVAARSAALPPDARELLAIAAELGPLIAFDTLAATRPGDGADLLTSLDAALASGLLVETGNAYAFAHPLYRLAVRGTLGPRRRGEACLRIARALAGTEVAGAAPDELERIAAGCTDPVTVAEQALEAAGLGVGAADPLAVAFGFAAGERASRLLDRGRAAELLARALAVWRRLPAEVAAGFDAGAAIVLLADLHKRAGADAEASACYREAARSARSPDGLARAYTSWFWLPYQHGDFDGALDILDEGIGRLPPGEPVSRARIRAAIGWCLVRLRRFDEAFEHLSDAALSLEAAGQREGTMQALDFLGVLLRYRGAAGEGIVTLERSLAIALELGDSRGEMLAQIHLAAALTRAGHPGRASPHADRALELAFQTGDRYAEAVAAWIAAERAWLAGDLEGAIDLRHRELRLLGSIGGNPHNEALAHAHLAHLARAGGDDASYRIEADEAVRLAAQSNDAGYPARIRHALLEEAWIQLET